MRWDDSETVDADQLAAEQAERDALMETKLAYAGPEDYWDHVRLIERLKWRDQNEHDWLFDQPDVWEAEAEEDEAIAFGRETDSVYSLVIFALDARLLGDEAGALEHLRTASNL